MNIDKIFELPNTYENEVKRAEIIAIYKGIMGVPQHKGVNICDVIEWAKTFKIFNNESENENMNIELDESMTPVLEAVDSDGFFFRYKVDDRINTMSLNYDAHITEVGQALYDFLRGCGFADSNVEQIINVDNLP